MSNSQFYNSMTSSFGYSSLGCYNPMSKNKKDDLGAFYPGVQIIPTYDAPGYDSLQHGNNGYEGGHFVYTKAYGKPNRQGCSTQQYVKRPCGPCKQLPQQTTQEPPYQFKQAKSLNDIPKLYSEGTIPPYMAQSTMSPYTKGTMPPYMAQSNKSPYTEGTMPPYMAQSTRSPYTEGTMPPYMEQTSMSPYMGQTTMPPYMGETTMSPYMGQTTMPPYMGETTMSP